MKKQDSRCLSQGFDDEDTRHDWTLGEMPEKKLFIGRDVLDRHDTPSGFDLEHPVNEEKRISMRQD